MFSVESEWQSTSVPRKHSKRRTSVIRKMGNVFAADLNEVEVYSDELWYLCNCACHCILSLSNIYSFLDGLYNGYHTYAVPYMNTRKGTCEVAACVHVIQNMTQQCW